MGDGCLDLTWLNAGTMDARGSAKTVDVVVTPARFDAAAPSGAEFLFTYDVEDNVGNKAVTQTRRVTMYDRKDPRFQLRGPTKTVHEAGTRYLDAGALAFDSLDGDLTDTVVIKSVVSKLPKPTNADGSYGREPCPLATTARVTAPLPGLFSSRVPHGSVYQINFQVQDTATNTARQSQPLDLVVRPMFCMGLNILA